MNRYPTVLADASRIRQFSILAYNDVFRGAHIEHDRDGHAWLLASEQDSTFGIPVMGNGRHFDAAARELWSEDHVTRVGEVRQMTATEQASELERLRRRFRFGPLSERLVWAIHLELLRQRQSSVRIPEGWLCDQVWPDRRPVNWRTELSDLLSSLSLLHISDSPEVGVAAFGDVTSILTDFQPGRRGETSQCPEQCLEHGRGRHGHIRITAGRGFLGCLERLYEGSDAIGKRVYSLASLTEETKVRRQKEKLLRRIGRDGSLTSILVATKLGSPDVIRSFTPNQQRLFQTLYRERTRCPEKHHEQIAGAERTVGRLVPPIAANRKNSPAQWILCPYLESGSGHSGFNGNGFRKGRGYQLKTWVARAMYPSSHEFLGDLGTLADRLGLIVVALAPQSRGAASDIWLDLDQLNSLDASRPKVASRYHLRVYVRDDFMERWCRLFNWELHRPDDLPDQPAQLKALIVTHSLTQGQLADALQVDRSDFSKMLRHKRAMPSDLIERASQWIAGRREQ